MWYSDLVAYGAVTKKCQSCFQLHFLKCCAKAAATAHVTENPEIRAFETGSYSEVIPFDGVLFVSQSLQLAWGCALTNVCRPFACFLILEKRSGSPSVKSFQWLCHSVLYTDSKWSASNPEPSKLPWRKRVWVRMWSDCRSVPTSLLLSFSRV